MTPEGRIKNKIKILLDSYGDRIYRYMPVPSGYGKRTVDYLLCVAGVFAAVEAKAPGGVLTALQDATLEQVRVAGGVTFVIASDEGVEALRRWIDQVLEGVP